MKIQYAKSEDADTVYSLIKMLGSDEFTHAEFLKAYSFNLTAAHCLVATMDDKIVGVGVLSIQYPLHHSKKIGEIVELVVDSEFRSNGVGKALIDEMTQIAMKNQCSGIEVASGQKRTLAHRFYEREGFVKTHYKLTKKLC